MMELHRRIRERVFSGEIYPAGDEPSGKSISGLISSSGVSIFFREMKAGHETAYFPELKTEEWKLIAGNGRLAKGKLTMPEKASFALFERISEE